MVTGWRYLWRRCAAPIAVALCLSVGVSPASPRPTPFCQGRSVPDVYFGRVFFALRPGRVTQGSYFYARLFNGLSRPIASDHLLWEQRYVDRRWTAWSRLPPAFSSDGTPIAPPLSWEQLASRSAGPCVRVTVEAGRPPGRYRLVSEVFTDLQSGLRRYRAAEFQVIKFP